MLDATLRLVRFRGLLWTLVARELKARYRGSLLGFFWSLVNPLLLLAVYSFVFTVIFEPRVAGTEPYPLFLMTGLFPWIWISTSLLEGSQSLLANAGLIRKAVFPAEILPMVSVLANLTHFVLALPILGGALVFGVLRGHDVGGWSALLLPFVIALELVVVGGLTIGLSALNVHFKDVKDILQNVMALLLYLTPIIYPLEWISVAPLRWIIQWLNPFTPFTVAFQRILFQGVLPEPSLVLHMVVWGVVAWSVGVWFFDRLSDSLVEAV
jgi:ABC-type polysaccharide/polyol phosphate export permease